MRKSMQSPLNSSKIRCTVTGIGGIFFRASDPAAIGQWYKENLGIDLVPSDYNQKSWSQEAGPTVFAPFPKDTEYFGNKNQSWMINFRIKDLDAMVAQLRSTRIEVTVDPETYPNPTWRIRPPF
jgi:hypothetical protein